MNGRANGSSTSSAVAAARDPSFDSHTVLDLVLEYAKFSKAAAPVYLYLIPGMYMCVYGHTANM